MSNEIKVPTVILTRNENALLGVIKDGLSRETLLKSDSIVLDSNQSNFISMVHDFGFNQNSGAKTHKITIELIDIDGRFNEKYILASLKKMVFGSNNELGNLNASNYEGLEQIKIEAEAQGDFGYIRRIFTDQNTNTFVNLPINISDVLYSPSFTKVEIPRSRTYVDALGKIETLNYQLDGLGASSIKGIDEKTAIEVDKGLKILLEANRNLSSIIDSQLRSLKSDITTTQMIIMYGIGANYSTWAGPFLCNLAGIDYKFNAATGAKIVELTFIPFGSVSMLTGDNVFKNGIGLNITDVRTRIFEHNTIGPHSIPNKDTTPPGGDNTPLYGMTINGNNIFSITQQDITGMLHSMGEVPSNIMGGISNIGKGIAGIAIYPSKLPPDDSAKTMRLLGKWNEHHKTKEQTRHSVVTSLIYQYLKKATIDMNILILLPDIDKITEKQHQVLRNKISKFLKGKSVQDLGNEVNIDQKGFLFNAYAQIELYRSLGFSIISTNHGSDFKGTENPIGFAEQFGSYLQDDVIEDTQVSLIKLPNQTFKEPLDNIMKSIASNGYPIEFELEVIHNSFYIRELHDFLVSKGRADIQDRKPILLVGDRAMIQKFLFGKKSLEDTGIIKYVPLASDKRKSISLDNLLVKEDQIFNLPEYTVIAKKYFLSDPPEYPYDVDSLPSDTFYFKDQEITSNILKSAGISVFRLGTENSNILDINSNLSMQYFAALQQIWFSETFRGRSHSGALNLIPGEALNAYSSSPKSNEEAMSNITVFDPVDFLDKIKELDGYDGALAKKLGISDTELEDTVTFIINLLSFSTGNRKMSIPVNWESDDSAFIQMIRLFNIINRSASVATIKTLPAFHLSDCIQSLPLTLLILDEPGIMNINNDQAILKTLSGFWRITGFEHKISNSDICSSFHLAKDFNSGTPIIPDLSLPRGAL